MDYRYIFLGIGVVLLILMYYLWSEIQTLKMQYDNAYKQTAQLRKQLLKPQSEIPVFTISYNTEVASKPVSAHKSESKKVTSPFIESEPCRYDVVLDGLIKDLPEMSSSITKDGKLIIAS